MGTGFAPVTTYKRYGVSPSPQPSPCEGEGVLQRCLSWSGSVHSEAAGPESLQATQWTFFKGTHSRRFGRRIQLVRR